ncbi:erbin isoform X1 [Lampetra fluviatilis]
MLLAMRVCGSAREPTAPPDIMSRKSKLLRRLVRCRCLRGEEETISTIDYSHCCLQQVPKDVFLFERTLEELYLDANQLEDLPKQLFSCVLLHKLSISDNDISILPLSIANLVNLHELDISKNGIQEIPENIKSCKLLTMLEASVNPISKLPEGATQLTCLTELYLNDAFLEALPNTMGRLTKLRVLELRENHLRTLPRSMSELGQLERLDLGSNEISEWPSVLEHMVALKELWMDGNQLQALPPGLGNLKRLSYLDASKNQVETMDPGVAGCETLEDLHLSSNLLCQLPDEIGCLKSLTTLKVDDNQLSLLPEALGDLDSLEELDCSGNQLELFPAGIGRLANLRTLTADENHFSSLPPEIGNCKNVTVLSLRCNRLEVLPSEMGDMTHLRVLNVSDNRLKFLPISFTSLKELTALWLSDNQSKPLIPLQVDEPADGGVKVLTNYMFPQQPRAPDMEYKSESESFNAELWEQQRQQRTQVAFEFDDQREERDPDTVKEGTLKRYPTPYPEELKNLVKTAQSVVNKIHSDGATAGTASGAAAAAARAATSKEALSAPADASQTPGLQPTAEGLAEGASRGGLASTVDGGTIQTTGAVGLVYSSSSTTTTVNNATVTNTTVIVNHYTQESEEDSEVEEQRKEEEERKPFLSEPQQSVARSPQLSALSQPVKRAEGAVPLSIGLDLDYNSNRNNSNGLSLVRDLPLLPPPTADSNASGSFHRQAQESLPDQIKSSPKGISAQPTAAEAIGGAVKVNGTPGSSGRPAVPAKPSVLYSAKTESVALTQSKAAVPTPPPSESLRHDEADDPAFIPPPLGAFERQQPDAGAAPERRETAVEYSSAVVTATNVVTMPSSERSKAGTFVATAEYERSREPSNLSASRAPLPALARSNSANAAETAPHGGASLTAGTAASAEAENAADVGIPRSLSAPLLDEERGGHAGPPAVPAKHVIYHFDSDFSPRSQRGQALAAQQQQQQYAHGTHDRYAQQQQQPPRPVGDTQFVFTSRHSSASSLPRTPGSGGGGQQFGYRCVDVPPGDCADYGYVHGQQQQQQRGGGLDRQGSVTSTGSDASGATGYSYQGYARGMPHSESDYMSPRDVAAMSRGGAPYGRPVSARSYTLDSGFYTQAHGQGGRPQSARPGPQHLAVGGRERAPSDVDPRAAGMAGPGGGSGARARSEHSLLAGPAGGSGARTPPPADWREQLLRHVENRMLEKGSPGMPGSPFDPSGGGPPRGWGTVSRGDGAGGGGGGGGGAANWATMGRPSGVGHMTVDGPAYGARQAARDYNRFPSQPLLGGPVGGCEDSYVAGVTGVTGTLSRKDVPPETLKPLSLPNGAPYRGPSSSQMVRHPSREELIDFLVQRQTMRTPTQGLQVLHRVPSNPHSNGYHAEQAAARRPEGYMEEVVVLIEKNPGLGFSISGGVGGQSGPFSPSNMGIFVTRVQPDGPAAFLLRPGDRIVKANGYNFADVAHERAVALLKGLENPVELVVRR